MYQCYWVKKVVNEAVGQSGMPLLHPWRSGWLEVLALFGLRGRVAKSFVLRPEPEGSFLYLPQLLNNEKCNNDSPEPELACLRDDQKSMIRTCPIEHDAHFEQTC